LPELEMFHNVVSLMIRLVLQRQTSRDLVLRACLCVDILSIMADHSPQTMAERLFLDADTLNKLLLGK
jgi:hypothetical protein